MKKPAKDLKVGDRIKPPANERKWLKSALTVVSVSPGRVDKGGLWLDVVATFISPYSGEASKGAWSFRPETLVPLS